MRGLRLQGNRLCNVFGEVSRDIDRIDAGEPWRCVLRYSLAFGFTVTQMRTKYAKTAFWRLHNLQNMKKQVLVLCEDLWLNE